VWVRSPESDAPIDTMSTGMLGEEAMADNRERNKAAIRRLLKAVEIQDYAVIADCMTEDCVQYYQRPSLQNDDGATGAPANRGREGILDEQRIYFHQLYKPGTVHITIENMIAEDEDVAVRFILRAATTRKGEAYENYYNFEYRCRDGKVCAYWEYVDSLYATKMLFS
jgi:ketosteroid isomerase-like protein